MARILPLGWTWSLALILTAPSSLRAQGAVPAARDVIARHVEAVGGKAALERVRSRKVWARHEVRAKRLNGTLELYAARPDKRVLKIEYPGEGARVTGYDGTIGWTKNPGESWKQVRGSDLDELRDDSIFDFDLHPDTFYRSITSVDVSRFENRECYRLHVVSRTGREWEEYYDVQTGLFAGRVFRRVTTTGDVTVRVVATRYQPYEGIRLPGRLSIRSAGVEQIVTVIRVEHNRVDASVFEPPTGVRPN